MLNIGEALKQQRESAGFSQSQLSKQTGLSQQTISWSESNKGFPKIDFLIQLADFYGITLDELIGRDSRGGSTSKYHIGTLNNNGGTVDMK